MLFFDGLDKYNISKRKKAFATFPYSLALFSGKQIFSISGA